MWHVAWEGFLWVGRPSPEPWEALRKVTLQDQGKGGRLASQQELDWRSPLSSCCPGGPLANAAFDLRLEAVEERWKWGERTEEEEEENFKDP